MEASIRKILIVIGCLAYVMSPIDLVPDFIPGLGQLDDLTVIALTVRALRRSKKDEDEKNSAARLKRLFA
ncbi:MAG: YkvA family protein [Planctomycetota bacterium]